MRTLLTVAGTLIVLAAIWPAVALGAIDRQMQNFRRSDARTVSFLFIPLRWRRALYTPDGQEFVPRAWRALKFIYLLGLVGGILLLLGQF